MPVIPENIEFIGKENYEIIFTSILPAGSDKCVVTATITDLDSSNVETISFSVPDKSQSCDELVGCDDSAFQSNSTYYTTLKLDNLILGHRYKAIASMQCATIGLGFK